MAVDPGIAATAPVSTSSAPLAGSTSVPASAAPWFTEIAAEAPSVKLGRMIGPEKTPLVSGAKVPETVI